MTGPTLTLLALLLAAPDDRVLDRVAAVVNGDPVTLSELQERAGLEWRRVQSMPPGPARDQAQAKALQAALDVIVAERLLEAQAKDLGVEASDAQVDAAIEDIKKKNRLDDQQLDRALEEQGLDRQSFRRQLRRDIEAFRILEIKVKARIKVTDEDVKSYYQSHPKDFAGDERVHLRHIFLPVPSGASPAEEAGVRAQADQVLQRLASGEDFAAVAKQVSQGPSAAEGGELGFVKRGAIQPELERAAFALDAGQVSPVVRTKSGFHILKVEERKSGGALPLEEVKDAIRDRLSNERVESQRAQYLAELRKDAVVEVRLPDLAP
ncbi:MAG TPA: peptidylprolyl isomerase [Anaeromyxobacteraceae bacterium]|nr:peptidylprolyl isomerase [Anaeromyxobacteraceae bacterium]